MDLPEAQRYRDPQRPARRRGETRNRLLGLVQCGEDRFGMRVEGRPFLGQRQAAGGAMEQPRAQPVFEMRHLLADGGRRHPELARSGGKSAGVDDPGEGRDFGNLVHGGRILAA